MTTKRRYQTAVALSAGGTAEVFKAWDEKLGRHVALKFLRRDDPTLVERMFREAKAQARLDHEGICKVYDVGELDGRPYTAMQYVDGVELA
ncbi:MAG: serine/threonine protein kinase, partial [Acidobacteriota bacterium]